MGNLISQFDWVTTSLGDPDEWPQSLLNSLDLLLGNGFPMGMGWGKDQIYFYNDASISLLADKHPMALGQEITIAFQEIIDVIRPFLADSYNGKNVFVEELPFVINVNNGPSRHFFTLGYQPIRVEDQSVGGVLFTIIDKTAAVLHRNALEESEKNFRNYQELSPFPFFSITKDWIVDYINPASLVTARRKREEVVGKPFWDAFDGIDKDDVFIQQNKRAMTGETVVFEAHHELYDNWYRVFSYPLNPGVGVLYQDITESKKMQVELSAAVSARDRFLSIASHELKTPLTSLKLHTQIMRRSLDAGVSEEKLKRFFEQTDLQISRLTSLIADVLDVSRIQEGKLVLNLKREDLKTLVSDSVERFAAYYSNAGVNPPSFGFEGMNFECMIDATRLEQVVSNLLMNALKYGEGKDVSVKVFDEGEKIVLVVKDNGQGIPESDYELIFGQFYRSNNSPGEGLGLGLYITQQIVNAHGGDISVSSIQGQGSEFRVELSKS